MVAVILAGGKGTRILEETLIKPKAMVEIGEKPIIEHIMETYISHGISEFLILAGYKSEKICEYFRNKKNILSIKEDENYLLLQFSDSKVTVLDTGVETGSAARLLCAKPYLENERFLLTYCDGLSSIDYNDLIHFHEEHGAVVTLTAVRPEQRFGILELMDDGRVKTFREKDRTDSPLINGGFMVMEPSVFDVLTKDMEHLEKDLLSLLAKNGSLMAYRYEGFWQCMDTLLEKKYLCSLWEGKNAPWKSQKKG